MKNSTVTKIPFRAFFVVVITMFGASCLKAQSSELDSMLVKSFDTDALLPVLIDSALKYSPDLKRMDNNIGLWQENTKVSKKAIYNSLSLVTSYAYGTSGDISITNGNTGAGALSNFKSTKQDRYNVGVNLVLPLGQLLSRKNTVKGNEYQVKIAEAERDNAVLYIKQQVIKLYQDFKLSQRLLKTASDSKQSAYINFQMSQKDFLQGQVTLDQFARVQDIYSKATIEFETYINHFQENYMQVEAYTGTTIKSLISKLK